MIRFQFKDPINGYIELDMNIPQERSVKGWTLAPHVKPLRVIIIVLITSCTYNYIQLNRRDADLFGSQELPVPQSCLITVWGKEADDAEELLSYSVGLKGIDSDSKEICVTRFLETTSDKGNIIIGNVCMSYAISNPSEMTHHKKKQSRDEHQGIQMKTRLHTHMYNIYMYTWMKHFIGLSV